jgi:hypothetical protein
MNGSSRVIFGYTHVGSEFPRCPCNDPGNYLMCERPDPSSLRVTIRCWCGATSQGSADDEDEITALATRYGSNAGTPNNEDARSK